MKKKRKNSVFKKEEAEIAIIDFHNQMSNDNYHDSITCEVRRQSDCVGLDLLKSKLTPSRQ